MAYLNQPPRAHPGGWIEIFLIATAWEVGMAEADGDTLDLVFIMAVL